MRRLALALSLIASLLVVACGEDDPQPAASGATTATEGAAAFPVTIEHRYGTTEIPAEPKRVVTVGLNEQDAFFALGVAPVGVTDWMGFKNGIGPWAEKAAAAAGAKPELLSNSDGIQFEKIAALRPDVILATNAFGLAETWPKLNRIAPVVGGLEGEGVDRWQDVALRVGRALGREDRARELVADVEAKVESQRADHPEFAGKTISFFNFFQGSPYVINSESDFSIRFLSEPSSSSLRLP
jgi:iron complex transport system substrate-binding protein